MFAVSAIKFTTMSHELENSVEASRSIWFHARSTTISLTVLLLFFLQPYLVTRFSLLFACVRMGTREEDLFLKEDLSVQCWISPTHFAYIFGFGIPLLVLYVAGTPLILYRILSDPKNRTRIAQITESLKQYELGAKHSSQRGAQGSSVAMKTKGFDVQDEGSRRFQTNYGFLFIGYNPEQYYWEVVVILRKAALSAIGVIFTFDVRGQVHLGLLVIIIATVAHAKYKPFVSPTMNNFELVSLSTSLLTFFFGIFTTDAGDSSTNWLTNSTLISLFLHLFLSTVLIALSLKLVLWIQCYICLYRFIIYLRSAASWLAVIVNVGYIIIAIFVGIIVLRHDKSAKKEYKRHQTDVLKNFTSSRRRHGPVSAAQHVGRRVVENTDIELCEVKTVQAAPPVSENSEDDDKSTSSSERFVSPPPMKPPSPADVSDSDSDSEQYMMKENLKDSANSNDDSDSVEFDERIASPPPAKQPIPPEESDTTPEPSMLEIKQANKGPASSQNLKTSDKEPVNTAHVLMSPPAEASSSDEESDSVSAVRPVPRIRLVEARKSWTASDQKKQLSFDEGDIIQVLKTPSKWHLGSLYLSDNHPITGQARYFPSNFVQPVSMEDMEALIQARAERDRHHPKAPEGPVKSDSECSD